MTTNSAATTTMQVSLAFSWLYFHLDNSFFSSANIHFIPEVRHSTEQRLGLLYSFP